MANTFKRKLSKAIGIAASTVGSYTVPATTTTTVIGMSLANTTVADITVDVMVNDGAIDYYLNKSCSIPAGSTLIVVGGDQKIVLLTGDSIKVQSSAASSVDVVMSILELS
jgi:hypothetical protein